MLRLRQWPCSHQPHHHIPRHHACIPHIFVFVSRQYARLNISSCIKPDLGRPCVRNSYADMLDAGNDHIGGMNGSRVSNNIPPYYSQRNQRDSYHEAPQFNPRARFGNRQHSDPALNRFNDRNGVYPQPTYGQSSATVNTGGSNGSASDQWHPSTDPSSENSSIDRAAKGDGRDQQAHRDPISEEGHYTYDNLNGGGYNPGYMGAPGMNGPPAPTPKTGAPPLAPRHVIKLGTGESSASSGAPISLGSSSGNVRPVLSSPTQEKRGSWLKRRFSKKD